MIYRIATTEDWDRAKVTGHFESADLADEGLIHCSALHQVIRVANTFYIGREDLVLLELDESQLTVPVRWEDLIGSGEIFPHVYGPIAIAAITRTASLKPNDAGQFALPESML